MATQINTVADMMKALQEAISEIRSGKVTNEQARLILGGHKAILTLQQMVLQHLRMTRGLQHKAIAQISAAPPQQTEEKDDDPEALAFFK